MKECTVLGLLIVFGLGVVGATAEAALEQVISQNFDEVEAMDYSGNGTFGSLFGDGGKWRDLSGLGNPDTGVFVVIDESAASEPNALQMMRPKAAAANAIVVETGHTIDTAVSPDVELRFSVNRLPDSSFQVYFSDAINNRPTTNALFFRSQDTVSLWDASQNKWGKPSAPVAAAGQWVKIRLVLHYTGDGAGTLDLFATAPDGEEEKVFSDHAFAAAPTSLNTVQFFLSTGGGMIDDVVLSAGNLKEPS